MARQTVTSHGITHTEHLDLDTVERGTDGPFENWEGDHTALVHVLWSAKHDGLIAERPDHGLPLDRAIFDRLFGDTSDRRPRADLIADLRSILDTFDPETTDGATGANRIDRDDIPEDKRYEGSGSDITASMILRSRWFAANKAEILERSQRENTTSL